MGNGLLLLFRHRDILQPHHELLLPKFYAGWSEDIWILLQDIDLLGAIYLTSLDGAPGRGGNSLHKNKNKLIVKGARARKPMSLTCILGINRGRWVFFYN